MARASDGGGAAVTEVQQVPVDLHRAFVFPNRMREQRRATGFPKLLRLAAKIPEIPYIRLSKIERGEVVPRVDELRRIACALDIAPRELLIDVDAAGFDIARWAEPFVDAGSQDLEEERFAVLLAAALRLRRTGDPALTIAAIDRDYGLPPVNLSRVENAQKPFGRWSPATKESLFRIFGVPNDTELRGHVLALYETGALDPLISAIANPGARLARTRERIAEVAAALAEAGPAPLPEPPAETATPSAVRRIGVLGAPLANGLIAEMPTGAQVEVPGSAGPRTIALRVCRATLGGGLPSQAVVIVDPDRSPAPGGLAALREEAGWRLLSVGSDRDGRTIGYSSNPPLEIALDDCETLRLAAVIAAVYP